MKTSNSQPQPAGFALLISLIVVGVVITVGLSVLDISITQVRLADNAEQSEIAFNAANAGVECAQFWSRTATTSMFTGFGGGNVIVDASGNSPECFGVSASNRNTDALTTGAGEITGIGEAYVVDYEFDWSGGTPRCTKIRTLAINANSPGDDLTVNNVPSHITEYPSTNFTCTGGSRCTILSVRGYNRACNNIGNFGTTEREVLLQF